MILISKFHLYFSSLAVAAILPRADPPFQSIPSTSLPPNTFHSPTVPKENGQPPIVTDIPPPVYGARSIDIPFGRMYHGNPRFFPKGQLNNPTSITDTWQPGIYDFANQSACGIPDDAWHVSKVAIHPYFLKYADLSRYCMQDVCIAFWNGLKNPNSSDMMLKVTDICSTDPDDPTACAHPGEIKLDRTKMQVMQHETHPAALTSHPDLMVDQFEKPVYWYFAKCWADGLVQPPYRVNKDGNRNWFADPPLPNNIRWAQQVGLQQYKNNQAEYPKRGWPNYPLGLYKDQYDDVISPPVEDWVEGEEEPGYCPVAGGKGWGDHRDCEGVASQ